MIYKNWKTLKFVLISFNNVWSIVKIQCNYEFKGKYVCTVKNNTISSIYVFTVLGTYPEKMFSKINDLDGNLMTMHIVLHVTLNLPILNNVNCDCINYKFFS